MIESTSLEIMTFPEKKINFLANLISLLEHPSV